MSTYSWLRKADIFLCSKFMPTTFPWRFLPLILHPTKNFCVLWTFILWAIRLSVTRWSNLTASSPPPLILQNFVNPHWHTIFIVAVAPLLNFITSKYRGFKIRVRHATVFTTLKITKAKNYLETVETRYNLLVTLSGMMCNKIREILETWLICPNNIVIFFVITIFIDFLWEIHKNWLFLPWLINYI